MHTPPKEADDPDDLLAGPTLDWRDYAVSALELFKDDLEDDDQEEQAEAEERRTEDDRQGRLA